MDNCRVHMAPAVRIAIEKAKASVRHLPKYSPLNPIELPYSKFKAYLRKVVARTVPHLNRAIRSFIPQLRPSECANYFRSRRLCFEMTGICFLDQAARHEAADPHALVTIERPHHGAPCPIWLRDYSIVRHVDPDGGIGVLSLWHANTIMTVLRFPIGVLDHVAVGERAAEAHTTC